MTARKIDGKAAAAALRVRIGDEVSRFREAVDRAPGLAVVLVGEDQASSVYVRSKGKATREAGMESFEHKLPATASQAELEAMVDQLNANPAVDGILVQLPLPPHIDETAIITRIDPDKDVDGFSPINVGRLAIGLDGFVPCTPLGCLKLLQAELGDLSGKSAVVIGRSNIVGKPMALLLVGANCTVTVAHSRTRDLPDVVRMADIVVAAVGRPHMIKGDWLKPGATVIDVGINRTDSGLVGDVDFESATQVAGAITPVPGGVGPMTIACLIRNTLASAARREGFEMEKKPVIVAIMLMAAAAQPAPKPAAKPMSAIDAERAFAADAQKIGQWTAFRKWSTPDALMFNPQPVNARAFFGKLKNPAVPVTWWPGRSYVSCDGTVAINTGPWVRDYGKQVGYFTTVWVRQKDGGWKWIYDAGDEEQFMRGEGGDIAPVVAACTTPKMPSVAASPPAGFKVGSGRSPDGSLEWAWAVGPDGSRTFLVNLWDGTKRQTVIEDKVAPKAATKPK